ncbi:MAG: universal stress protein [Hyphomonadaceae bacterium]|nr:universal stress protein [Hyphomonadaceae bacterium]
MFNNILIATDGSELAEKAVQQGLSLAKDMHATATVVRATPIPRVFVAEGVVMPPPPEVHDQIVQEVNAQFARIKSAASVAGVTCDTVHVDDDLPWHAILDTADKKKCDLIVMASHGRSGFSAAFLGSETQSVLAKSSIPVLVCR